MTGCKPSVAGYCLTRLSPGTLEQLEIIPKSSLASDQIYSPSTSGDRVTIKSTGHETSNLPHDVSDDAEHISLKQQKSPNLPLGCSGHAEEPQLNEQRDPDLSLGAVGDTEKPQPKE